MRNNQTQQTVATILMVAALFVGVAAANLFTSASAPARASTTLESGVDTLLIVLLSARCAACTDADGIMSFRNAVDSLRSRANHRVRLVGVSVDPGIDEGRRLLDRYCAWDEISLGGGWAGEYALQHLWEDEYALPGVPQLIAVQRVLRRDSISGRIQHADSVIDRAYGLRDMMRWMDETLLR